MDFKKVRENLQKYYVKHGVAVAFGDAAIKDPDIAVEAEVSWYVNEEAQRRRKQQIEDNYAKVQAALAKGIEINMMPEVGDIDSFITQILSEYAIDGSISQTANNQAIRKILESDGEIELEFNVDSYNTNFLTNPSSPLGLAALRYLARKQEFDIVSFDTEVIRPEEEKDANTYKVKVMFTKQPIEKKAEEVPIQQPVAEPENLTGTPSEESPKFEETQQQEEPGLDSLTTQEPQAEPTNPPVEPPIDFFGESEIAEAKDKDTPIQGATAKNKKTAAPKIGIFDRINGFFAERKAKKYNARMDATISIEEIQQHIEEARQMEGNDSRTVKYWTNILCQKQGKPLAYPELLEEFLPQEVKDELAKIDTIIAQAIESKDELTVERMQEMRKKVIENSQNKSTPEEAKAQESETAPANETTHPMQEEKQHQSPLSIEHPEIGITGIKFDETLKTLQTAIANHNKEEIGQAISKITFNFPQPTVRKYAKNLRDAVDTNDRQKTDVYFQALSVALPGREEQLNSIEEMIANLEIHEQDQEKPKPDFEEPPATDPQPEENTDQIFDINNIVQELIKSLAAAIAINDKEDIDALIALIRFKMPPKAERYLDKLSIAIDQNDNESIMMILDLLPLTQWGKDEELAQKEQMYVTQLQKNTQNKL